MLLLRTLSPEKKYRWQSRVHHVRAGVHMCMPRDAAMKCVRTNHYGIELHTHGERGVLQVARIIYYRPSAGFPRAVELLRIGN